MPALLFARSAVVALAAVLVLAGCAPRGSLAPFPPVSESDEPTELAVPDEAPDADYVGGTLRQATTYDQMLALSVDDFSRLPYADRLAFAIERFGEAFPLDSPNTVMDAAIIPGFFWQYAYGTSFNDGDPSIRAKLIANSSYYTTDVNGEILTSRQEAVEIAVEQGGEGVGSSNAFVFVDHGALQHGVDFDGNPIDFANVTYHVTTADVDQPDVTTQAIRVQVALLDGRTVVYYAQGYTAKGHVSPDTDYSY